MIQIGKQVVLLVSKGVEGAQAKKTGKTVILIGDDIVTDQVGDSDDEYSKSEESKSIRLGYIGVNFAGVNYVGVPPAGTKEPAQQNDRN